jgi:hypothetical protein
VQIMAGSAAFDLQVVTPANTNGANGEGPTFVSQSVVAPAATVASSTTPVVAAATSTASTVTPEGESSANELSKFQVYTPVVSRPIQAPTRDESVPTTASTQLPVPVIPLELLATNTGQMVSLSSQLDQSGRDSNLDTDEVTDETRAALLVEVANEYGDPFRYGASSGGAFVPLEDELSEGSEEVEVVPADLLDELAAAVATA